MATGPGKYGENLSKPCRYVHWWSIEGKTAWEKSSLLRISRSHLQKETHSLIYFVSATPHLWSLGPSNPGSPNNAATSVGCSWERQRCSDQVPDASQDPHAAPSGIFWCHVGHPFQRIQNSCGTAEECHHWPPGWSLRSEEVLELSLKTSVNPETQYAVEWGHCWKEELATSFLFFGDPFLHSLYRSRWQNPKME